MEITYDKQADAMYIDLREGTFGSNIVIGEGTIIDLDKDGEILGIELLSVSKRASIRTLLSDVKIKQIDNKP